MEMCRLWNCIFVQECNILWIILKLKFLYLVLISLFCASSSKDDQWSSCIWVPRPFSHFSLMRLVLTLLFVIKRLWVLEIWLLSIIWVSSSSSWESWGFVKVPPSCDRIKWHIGISIKICGWYLVGTFTFSYIPLSPYLKTQILLHKF